MAKLKLGPIPDEKPVRLTTELPAAVHRDLLAYAEVLSRATGQRIEPAQLVAPMLARFMATDREFARARKAATRATAKLAERSTGAPPRDGEKRPETA